MTTRTVVPGSADPDSPYGRGKPSARRCAPRASAKGQTGLVVHFHYLGNMASDSHGPSMARARVRIDNAETMKFRGFELAKIRQPVRR